MKLFISAVIALATLLNVLIFAYSSGFLQEPDIKVEADDHLNIGHSWGNFIFSQQLNFTNVGKAQGTVAHVDGWVRKKDTKRTIVKFNNYSFELGALKLINLKSDAFWNGTVYIFQEEFDRNKDSIAKYKTFIYDYIDSLSAAPTYGRPSEVDDNSFQPIEHYLIKRIEELMPGEYYYYVRIRAQNKKILFENLYSFVIRSSDVRQLKDINTDYKKGQRIFWNYNTNIQYKPWVHVSLSDLNDNALLEEYKKNNLIDIAF